MATTRAVALGGGHGLAAALGAIKLVADEVTAIVTVADDGGSSGRLRDEFDVLPPGDLRMALAALCDDGEWGHLWRDVLQHRFAGSGPLAGHALGNLLIVSLWDLLGDTVQGLDLVGRLLNSRGRVLPMAAEPLQIEADILPDGESGGRPTPTTVIGQHRVATTTGKVLAVRLRPQAPDCPPETIEAVLGADVVLLGPGSWFTSVLPHLLVPDLRSALAATGATKVLNLNVVVDTGEARGYQAADHVDALLRHAPDLHLDVVLADPSVVTDEAALTAAVRRVGAELVIAPIRRPTRPGQHDSLRLAAAYRDIFG